MNKSVEKLKTWKNKIDRSICNNYFQNTEERKKLEMNLPDARGLDEPWINIDLSCFRE